MRSSIERRQDEESFTYFQPEALALFQSALLSKKDSAQGKGNELKLIINGRYFLSRVAYYHLYGTHRSMG